MTDTRTTMAPASEEPTTSVDTTAVSSVTCSFAMRNCDHETIFQDVYVRTNRTNHTKIMRCFPHCCPHHRERTYCGSGIRFEMFSGSMTLRKEDVVVYARFRPFETAPLVVGDRLKVTEIEEELQAKNPSKGVWVTAEFLVHDTSKNLWCFEINPSGRWYYAWSGVYTSAMRNAKHVFEAIAFRKHATADLELLGWAASPTFTLMSFRRSAENKSSNQIRAIHGMATLSSPIQAVVEGAKALAVPSKVAPMRNQKDMPGEVNKFRLTKEQVQRNKRARREDDGTKIASSSNEDPKAYRAHSLRQWRETQSIDTLSMLLRWLEETPASAAGSRWLIAWEQVVFGVSYEHVRAARKSAYLRPGLVPLLEALDVCEDTPQLGSGDQKRTISPLDAIDSAVRVVLHEWLCIGSARASYTAAMKAVRADYFPNRQQLDESYLLWMRDAEARAKRFLQSQTTWMHLVGKASGLRLQQQQHSTDEFSFRAFVAQCRQQFLTRNKGSASRRQSCKRRKCESVVPIGLHVSARVWRCRMKDVTMISDGVSSNPLTLLVVMQFWRHLSCIRLDYLSDGCGQLSVASIFSATINNGGYTKLVLDGIFRWFDSLPSGTTTLGTSLMGYIVGDYVGYKTSAGTIHATTFLWPVARIGAVAYAWHWIVDATSLSGESLVVSLVVERAVVKTKGLPSTFEAMTINEKLRSIGRWQHLSEFELVYHADE